MPSVEPSAIRPSSRRSPRPSPRPLTASEKSEALAVTRRERVTQGELLVERTRVLLEAFPYRLTGSAGERGLQEACAEELVALGGVAEWQGFRWGKSIYASLALHFGLASAALVVGFWAPLVAAAVHVVVAVSYASESARKKPLLRALLPQVSSQNAIVTFPARAAMSHRIVTLAHADAAYTGLLFRPSIVRMAAKETQNPIGRAFRKGLALATFSLLPLAALEAGARFLPASAAWPVLSCLLVLPAFAAFVLNLDIVVRNQVVPAANDNLSGCVATLELARRLVGQLPDDIELVTVITGCEEAGTGGASNLARSFLANGRWSTANTVVLALDTFSGGEARLLQEGELIAARIPPALSALAAKINDERPELAPVTPYEIPSGATDAWPFLVMGFESVGITCIDPALGAPRNYHLPSDTAANLDAGAFERTFDFTERFITALAAQRSKAPWTSGV